MIDVEAVGVNFIEIYQREGAYSMSHPFTPGAEAAGTVIAVGNDVRDFRVGDRIMSQSVRGAYAERTLVSASRAVRIPDGVDTRTAAAVCLQGLTAHYLTTSTFPIQSGHRCVVHAAAGGVGLLLCQIASQRGAHVIGTASSDEKLKLARDAGARDTIDYKTHDFLAEVRRITGGAGVHVDYDSVGRDTFDRSLDCLVRRGMMVLFGQSSGAVPAMDPQILNRKGSLFLTRPTLNHYVDTRDELLHRSTDLFDWIRAGRLKVRIGAEFPLRDAAEAHRALASRRTTGKVLLIPT